MLPKARFLMPNRAHGRLVWDIISTLGIKFDLPPIEYNLENNERSVRADIYIIHSCKYKVDVILLIYLFPTVVAIGYVISRFLMLSCSFIAT